MRSYSVFAQYYDELTSNVEYPKRAEYLLELMERLGHAPGLTLDLACGTGSLTLELYKRGVDIYGIDDSVEMLSEARTKCAEAGRTSCSSARICCPSTCTARWTRLCAPWTA